MNESPTVSVILPNYNHALYLPERIESILRQTYQDFELILLDDCSTDNSRDILNRYKNHPKVSALVLNEQNTGNTFLQWERGILLARGKYVWIAESDDSADPRFLELTVDALERHPGAVMCLSGSILIDGQGNCKKRPSRDRWKETGEVKEFDGHAYVEHNLMYRNYVYNASMVLFRREVYGQVDKVFQRYRCAGDWLFWAEVCRTGRVLEVRLKLNRFRQHANKVSSRAKQTGEGVADTIEVMRRVLQCTPVSRYKRWMLRGECYRIIRRTHLPSQVRAGLFAQGKKQMRANVCCYLLNRLNSALSCLFPALPTHRGDKLK